MSVGSFPAAIYRSLTKKIYNNKVSHKHNIDISLEESV